METQLTEAMNSFYETTQEEFHQIKLGPFLSGEERHKLGYLLRHYWEVFAFTP